MIAKDRIFKKGDVIVSGWGNVRILVGETGSGVAADGAKNTFYDALTVYCPSDTPAGTDMRYARHATEREKMRFFTTLAANGLVLDVKACTITAGEDYDAEDTENYFVNRYDGDPMPFKVLKKRVRPTLKQVKELEVQLKNEQNLHIHFAKECDKFKANIKILEGSLKDAERCNEKLSKELSAYIASNRTLSERNNDLEKSNKLMDAELTLQRGRANELRSKVSELAQSDKEGKEYIDYLLGRGFFARLFNLK